MNVTVSSGSRKKSKGGGIFAALICVVIGLVFGYFTKDMVAEARESENWPSVTGSVVASEISSYVDRSEGKTQTMYSAYVEAVYEVDGARYTTTSVDLAGSSSTSVRSLAGRQVDRFPVGASVPVYYDPNDPGRGVLTPGMTWPIRIMNAVPIIMFVFAGLALIRGILRIAGFATALGFLAAKRNRGRHSAAPSPELQPASPGPTAPPRPAGPAVPTEPSRKTDDSYEPPIAGKDDDGFSI